MNSRVPLKTIFLIVQFNLILCAGAMAAGMWYLTQGRMSGLYWLAGGMAVIPSCKRMYIRYRQIKQESEK